jgi:chromosome segregation ATPase
MKKNRNLWILISSYLLLGLTVTVHSDISRLDLVEGSLKQETKERRQQQARQRSLQKRQENAQKVLQLESVVSNMDKALFRTEQQVKDLEAKLASSEAAQNALSKEYEEIFGLIITQVSDLSSKQAGLEALLSDIAGIQNSEEESEKTVDAAQSNPQEDPTSSSIALSDKDK